VTRVITPSVLVGVAATLGCTVAPPAPDVAAVRRTIDSMLVEHAQVLIREDFDAAMSLYSDDPVIRPNHVAPQRGREALGRFIAGWFTGLNFHSVQYNNEEVAVFGDTALVIGSVSATVQPEGGNAVSDLGSYMVLLVKDSTGRWRSHRGVFNRSLPLATPAASTR
jgi:ketosteroid isomerase-like protein